MDKTIYIVSGPSSRWRTEARDILCTAGWDVIDANKLIQDLLAQQEINSEFQLEQTKFLDLIQLRKATKFLAEKLQTTIHCDAAIILVEVIKRADDYSALELTAAILSGKPVIAFLEGNASYQSKLMLGSTDIMLSSASEAINLIADRTVDDIYQLVYKTRAAR